MIKHVDYIWNATSFPTWNKNNIIDTGIFAESDCEIRIAYQGAGANVDRIVGFSQESTAGDSDDFRIFYYSNGSFDWGNARSSNLGLSGFIGSGVDYDITMGNGWLYNNLTSSYIYQSSTATYNHNCSIRVDVGGQKVKSLQIKNGGVVVFDAFAALDNSSNVVGLYDTVSDTMFTNNSLNLTYGEIINTFEISPETMELPYSGGSSALTITTDEGWTASTNDSWLTLSSTAGTGDSTINVTASENASFQAKIGTITVTDGNDTLTCSISQEKHPVFVKSNNIYFEDTKVNKMYLNGAIIYQNVAITHEIDYSKEYLTFDVLTGGTINWVKHNSNAPSITISYSINNGNWIEITSDYSAAAPSFNVNAGDKVRIKGNNNRYCATGSTSGATQRNYYNAFRGDTIAKYNVEGNIMSLIYGDNFIGNNEFPDTLGWNFKSLFEECKNVLSAKNLILPPTILYQSSFRALFSNSTLTEAPDLLAPTLGIACYSYFFQNTGIDYVKCMATDISASACLYNWMNGISGSGTFVKKTGVTYPSGNSGIPTGWAVIDE